MSRSPGQIGYPCSVKVAPDAETFRQPNVKIAEHGFKRETVSACRGRGEAVDLELRFPAATPARYKVWTTNTRRTVQPRFDRFTVDRRVT